MLCNQEADVGWNKNGMEQSNAIHFKWIIFKTCHFQNVSGKIFQSTWAHKIIIWNLMKLFEFEFSICEFLENVNLINDNIFFLEKLKINI